MLIWTRAFIVHVRGTVTCWVACCKTKYLCSSFAACLTGSPTPTCQLRPCTAADICWNSPVAIRWRRPPKCRSLLTGIQDCVTESHRLFPWPAWVIPFTHPPDFCPLKSLLQFSAVLEWHFCQVCVFHLHADQTLMWDFNYPRLFKFSLNKWGWFKLWIKSSSIFWQLSSFWT